MPGLLPPGRIASSKTIQSGTVATNSADKLEGMNCAAHTTPPLPQTSRKMPIIAALRHCTELGIASPASRRKNTKNAPEMMKRVAAERNGGMGSKGKSIRKKGEPHDRQT